MIIQIRKYVRRDDFQKQEMVFCKQWRGQSLRCFDGDDKDENHIGYFFVWILFIFTVEQRWKIKEI